MPALIATLNLDPPMHNHGNFKLKILQEGIRYCNTTCLLTKLGTNINRKIIIIIWKTIFSKEKATR